MNLRSSIDLGLLTALMFDLGYSCTDCLGSRSLSDLSEEEAVRDSYSL